MIRSAVIGVGYWGPNLLRNLADHPKVEVKWACDKETLLLAKAKKRHPNLLTTPHSLDVMTDPEVDLVAIATPVHTHFELAKAALRNGKHVLLTKPMARTAEECERLIELADKHKRILMVDHTFVFHPAVSCLKKMVQTNELGELLYYQSSRMNLGLYQPDVSVIYDLMPHDLSILNELVDEDPIEISVAAKHAARLPQADIAYINLSYSSDFIASIQASWLSPMKIRQTIVTGRKKMAVYDDNDVVQKVKVFDKGIEALNLADREASYTQFLQYRQGDIYAPSLPAVEALKLEVEHLVDCIEHSRTPHTDGRAGLRVVRILEAADTLARAQSSWVRLDSGITKTAKSVRPAKSRSVHL